MNAQGGKYFMSQTMAPLMAVCRATITAFVCALFWPGSGEGGVVFVHPLWVAGELVEECRDKKKSEYSQV